MKDAIIEKTYGMIAVSKISGCARSSASNSAGATCIYEHIYVNIPTFKHWTLSYITIEFLSFYFGLRKCLYILICLCNHNICNL